MSEYIQSAIVEMLELKGRSIIFPDLEKIDGFVGEWEMVNSDLNVVVWTDMSQDALEAVVGLVESEVIILEDTLQQEYHYRGYVSPYPLATRRKKYATPHWTPALIDRGPKFLCYDE